MWHAHGYGSRCPPNFHECTCSFPRFFAATRPRTEGEIPAKELISKELYTCSPDDEVRLALGTMKARKVRRLPVVERDGRLVGIVSIHDIAVQSRSKSADVSPDAVLDAFIAITAPAQVSVTA